jgi:hypothetical protein
MKSIPALNPKEAPAPDIKINLGLIGLKTEASVMTAPPAKYAGRASRRSSSGLSLNWAGSEAAQRSDP